MWPEFLWVKYIRAIFVFSHLSVSSAWFTVLFMLYGALKPREKDQWNASFLKIDFPSEL